MPDWLRPQLKAALARISSSLLGGSPELVEVEFTVIPHGFCFRGGDISTTSMVRGSIPPGCAQMVRVDIMQRICDVWRDLTGCAADELVVSVPRPESTAAIVQRESNRRKRCRSTAAWFRKTRSRSSSANKWRGRSPIFIVGLTGAPRNFVHVAFFANEDPEFSEPYYIDGGNRAGRPAALREQLLAQLMRAFRDITGVPANQLGGRITEGPASWTMEAGRVLPEPGEEGPEWRHPTASAATGETAT